MSFSLKFLKYFSQKNIHLLTMNFENFVKKMVMLMGRTQYDPLAKHFKRCASNGRNKRHIVTGLLGQDIEAQSNKPPKKLLRRFK
jgi:dihydrofolate reductase